MTDFSQIPPELLQQLIAMGALDEESQAADEQIQWAQALMQPSGARHTTAGGAFLGGLGDAAKILYGSQQLKDARQQKADIRGRRTKGRRTGFDLMFGPAARGDAGDDTSDAFGPATPFGYAAAPVSGGAQTLDPFAYGYVPGMYKKPGPYR